VRIGVFGLQRYRAAITGHGCARLSESHHRGAEIVVGLGVIGLKSQRPIKASLGLFCAVQAQVRHA
jgi:hypothetical protein